MNSENPPTVSDRIYENLESLTPAERRVAQVILETYPMLSLRPASVIAAESDTSPATVVRFAAKIGFEGLPGLQDSIRVEIDTTPHPPAQVYRPLAVGDSPSVAAADATLALVTDALNRLKQEQVDEAVSLILGARRLWLYGGRLSHGIAFSFYAHLNLLRTDVHLLESWPAPVADQIAHAGRDELAIVIDYRHYDPTAEFVASHFAGSRGKVIAITDQFLSPAAQRASVTFVAPMEGAGLIVSQAGALAVAEVISSNVAARSDHPMLQRMKKIQASRARAAQIADHHNSTIPAPTDQNTPDT